MNLFNISKTTTSNGSQEIKPTLKWWISHSSEKEQQVTELKNEIIDLKGANYECFIKIGELELLCKELAGALALHYEKCPECDQLLDSAEKQLNRKETK